MDVKYCCKLPHFKLRKWRDATHHAVKRVACPIGLQSAASIGEQYGDPPLHGLLACGNHLHRPSCVGCGEMRTPRTRTSQQHCLLRPMDTCSAVAAPGGRHSDCLVSVERTICLYASQSKTLLPRARTPFAVRAVLGAPRRRVPVVGFSSTNHVAPRQITTTTGSPNQLC